MTLWPFIVYRKGYETQPGLRAHEEYHWQQALRRGVVTWYLAYGSLMRFYLRKPWRHPTEVGAHRVQLEAIHRLSVEKVVGKLSLRVPLAISLNSTSILTS